ncbi:hypothetical protein BC938DRAFT_474720 [Jimgerdemannia flammicorona]|uniref:F-box domain-containing protein n=1 Tax=Jimgerdemannia flammicorona TaxID=994334 RepID=A0A433QZL1_9FUNG|nr:hypothetical protein BC938DRAFT_474720 [Jimgerdemannia flammicorona]
MRTARTLQPDAATDPTRPATLPSAVLTAIFAHHADTPIQLRHLALVCRAWSAPALQLLWASFKITKERDFERVFTVLTRRTASRDHGSLVRKLELVHSEREPTITAHTVLLISVACPNLEEISLTFNPPPRRPPGALHGAPHALHGAPHATPDRLHLPLPLPRPQNGPSHSPGSSAAAAAAIAGFMHSAAHAATQTSAHHTPPLPLAHLAHNCPRLHTVHLTAYSPKNDDTLYELAKYLAPSSLRVLTLTSCATLQGSTIRKFAKSQPSLRRFEVMGHDTALTDTSVTTISESCGARLEAFSVGNAAHLTDASLSLIPKHCPNLRTLCLIDNQPDHISEAVLTDIVGRCRRLEELTVSNARAVGEKFLGAVVERVMEEVGREMKGTRSGPYLKRMSLGNVRRDVPALPAMRRLIELGGGVDASDEDEEEDAEEWGEKPSFARLKKVNVIRNGSVWWQRKRKRWV